MSRHWEKGGDGALEFADAVVDACNEKNNFKFLYELTTPLRQRIELIAKEQAIKEFEGDRIFFVAGAIADTL